MWLADASAVQKLDRLTAERFHVSTAILMERAGLKIAENICRYFPSKKEDSYVLVLAGKGNNGGDGAVAARELFARGFSVQVLLASRFSKISALSLPNFRALKALSVPIVEIGHTFRKREKDLLSGAGLIVDALLGTGMSRPPASPIKEIIAFTNKIAGEKKIPVVAVDIPSGVNGDDGTVPGVSIQADLTVTFSPAKIGLFITPGKKACGKVVIADIGIPKILLEELGAEGPQLLADQNLAPLLPKREISSHKGTAGRVLIIGGSKGKIGAASLAASAALRVGAGLVMLRVPEHAAVLLDATLTEVLVEEFPRNKKEVVKLLFSQNACAIGPGIGTSPQAIQLLQWVLRTSQVPVVIDADGLNILAKNKNILLKAKCPIILTPHAGEMARLMRVKPSFVQENRLRMAKQCAEKFGCTVVLKGNGTLIASADGRIRVNSSGGVLLATAGTGDVLTGMIAGFLAQGLDPQQGAMLAVFLHGEAGDGFSSSFGDRGLIASDLLCMIPKVIRKLKNLGSA